MTEQWKLVLAVGAVAIGGIATGAWLFGPGPAQAQQRPFRECIIVRQESVDVDGAGQLARFGAESVIVVPPGYEPIGGGGLHQNWTGGAMLCRR